MTRKDVVGKIARAYSEGVGSAMKGELLSLDVLKGLIEETYIHAWENGMSFAKWGMFPSEMYNLQTEKDAYKTYAQDKL